MFNALQKHLNHIKLTLLEFSPSRGLRVEFEAGDDHRVFRVTKKIRSSPSRFFWTSDPGAAHAIRAIARIRCLQKVHMTRLDSEGVDQIDVDASSHPNWKDFEKSLDAEAKMHLEIFRAGAVKTRTRHQSGLVCECCEHPWPSMRHLWQECPCFNNDRATLRQEFKLHPNFWFSQPRATSKIGWITYNADRGMSAGDPHYCKNMGR